MRSRERRSKNPEVSAQSVLSNTFHNATVRSTLKSLKAVRIHTRGSEAGPRSISNLIRPSRTLTRTRARAIPKLPADAVCRILHACRAHIKTGIRRLFCSGVCFSVCRAYVAPWIASFGRLSDRTPRSSSRRLGNAFFGRAYPPKPPCGFFQGRYEKASRPGASAKRSAANAATRVCALDPGTPFGSILPRILPANCASILMWRNSNGSPGLRRLYAR